MQPAERASASERLAGGGAMLLAVSGTAFAATRALDHRAAHRLDAATTAFERSTRTALAPLVRRPTVDSYASESESLRRERFALWKSALPGDAALAADAAVPGAVGAAAGSVVQVHVNPRSDAFAPAFPSGAGSGWVAAPELVVSNAHVTQFNEHGIVHAVSPGSAHPQMGVVVATDWMRDLSVVYVPGLTAPPLATAAPIGERAVLYGTGYPGAPPSDATRLAPASGARTHALVTVPKTAVTIQDFRDGAGVRWEVVESTGPATGHLRGMSGGPMLDARGAVVGTVTRGAEDGTQVFASDAQAAVSMVAEARAALRSSPATAAVADGARVLGRLQSAADGASLLHHRASWAALGTGAVGLAAISAGVLLSVVGDGSPLTP